VAWLPDWWPSRLTRETDCDSVTSRQFDCLRPSGASMNNACSPTIDSVAPVYPRASAACSADWMRMGVVEAGQIG